MNKVRLLLCPLFLLLMLAGGVTAKERVYFTRGQAAAEVAIWKPSDLDAHPSKPFKNVEGALPEAGLSATSPTLFGLCLRLGAHQWSQRGLRDRVEVESIQLRQISLEIKNQLVSQARISPYVAYGISFFWGHEENAASDDLARNFIWMGRGINIGAGVDFALLRHWGLAAEYQYIYTDFSKTIGLTANYSGPKLACKLLYIF